MEDGKKTTYVLGVDFETTGLIETEEVVTEIGAVLWDWEAQKPVLLMSELLKLPEGKKITPEVVQLTGITNELTAEFGIEPTEGFKRLNKMGEKADYVMAHNAQFDKKFYNASMKRIEMSADLDKKIWLDTVSDVDYPKDMSTRKLTHLASEHGFLNPFAHRAVFDVLTMLSVVKNYSIDDIVKYACEEKYELRAAVSFDDKQKAKDKGFHWAPADKLWLKTVGESKIKEEVASCDFQVYSRKKDKEKDWRPVKNET